MLWFSATSRLCQLLALSAETYTNSPIRPVDRVIRPFARVASRGRTLFGCGRFRGFATLHARPSVVEREAQSVPAGPALRNTASIVTLSLWYVQSFSPRPGQSPSGTSDSERQALPVVEVMANMAPRLAAAIVAPTSCMKPPLRTRWASPAPGYALYVYRGHSAPVQFSMRLGSMAAENVYEARPPSDALTLPVAESSLKVVVLM